MVDYSETSKQPISRPRGNSLRSNFWTEVLSKNGLESPGYQETAKLIKEKYQKEKGHE